MEKDRVDRYKRMLEAGNVFDEVLSDKVKPRSSGRIIQIHALGKIIFMQLDNFGITAIRQISIKKTCPSFEIAKLAQVGDIVSCHGTMGKTERGVDTLFIETEEDKFVITTKCLTWVGKIMQDGNTTQDPEELYRKPYRRFNINREDRNVFYQKAKIINRLRTWFMADNFLEVNTRTLVNTNGGANAEPFVTHYNAIGEERSLRVAPELDLKRLIASGFDRIFEIGPNWRNEGTSKRHNPEFLSLEAYIINEDYNYWIGVFDFVFGILFQNLDKPVIKPIIKTVSEFVAENTLGDVSYERLIEALDAITDDKELMAKYPYLILKEYPTYDSPLAKRIKNNPLFVERAEVYVNGMEIANMYSENTDPVYQREVFLKQVKKKEDKTIDEDFIEALEHGIPPCAGIGIGIERLCMILLGLNSIRDVIFFPAYKSK